MITMMFLMFAVGLALSAFFSGTETGFYRVARVRLVMDAKSGNWISLALLWMANRTSLLVATVLIGNNLANYVISLSLVLLSSRLISESAQVQTLVPILVTPFVFIYGELMPKLLFFHTPYRFLRAGAPLIVLFSILFLPISILVFAYEAVWSYFTGGSKTKIGYSLGRQEIQRALVESQAAGVVVPMQRELAENLFTFGGHPIRQFAIPLRAIPLVDIGTPRQQVLNAAVKLNSSIIGITQNSRITGCCLAAEVRLDLQNPLLPVLPICEVLASEPSIQVLTRMQATHAPLGHVIDSNGRAIGVVTRERLTSLLIAD